MGAPTAHPPVLSGWAQWYHDSFMVTPQRGAKGSRLHVMSTTSQATVAVQIMSTIAAAPASAIVVAYGMHPVEYARLVRDSDAGKDWGVYEVVLGADPYKHFLRLADVRWAAGPP